LADLTNAEIFQTAGVEARTHTKCDLAWRRWLLYLHEAHFSHDPFLDGLKPVDRTYLLSITFRYQKRDERDDIITHHRNLDPVMCPVKAWAHVVRRLLRLFEVVLILKGWTCDSGGLWTVLVLFFKDF